MEAVLIFVGILTIIGIIFVVGFWMDRKRREAIQKIAEQLGLTFYPDGLDSALQGIDHFKLFNHGRARKQSKAIVAESEGTFLCIFDYQYTVGSGKHSHTHRQTVAAIKSPALQMPEFAMKNEGLFNKIGGMLGFQDIDFESHPTFSKMFLLTGNNEQAIRKLFRPELLEYFESRKGISVEGGYGAFVYYVPDRQVKPDDIKSFMTTAYEIYSQLLDSIETISSQEPAP